MKIPENRTATMQDAAHVQPPTFRNAFLLANPEAGDEATF
jgi:hypothetical protein